MKTLIALLIVLCATVASAADVKLEWNPMPAGQAWTQVRIYERLGIAGSYIYTPVGQVAGSVNTATVSNVSTGTHTYVARSYNGQAESVDSNAVTGSVLGVPSAPTNVTITITVTVQ